MERLSILLKAAMVAFCFLSLSCESKPTAPSSDQDTTFVNDYRTIWLATNASRLRSVDPSDLDFSDLQSLKAAVGNSRLVMLGEQSHGHGKTFLAKTRIVKFLHEEMGFDVLAFESGLFDCHKAWEFLQNGENPVTAVRRGVYAIWTMSDEFQPVIDYIGQAAQTSQPLELAGFDCQASSSASQDFLTADFAKFLTSVNSTFPARPDWPSFRNKLDSLTRYLFLENKLSLSEQAVFIATLDSLLGQLDSLSATALTREMTFWLQVLRSVKAEGLSQFRTAEDPNNLGPVLNIRDAQMADNLLWLSNIWYPKRKIIVWAATSHVMHNEGQIDTMDPSYSYSGYTTMGEIVWQAMGDNAYALAFTAYEGSAGLYNEKPHDIGKASTQSLENLMRSGNLQSAFVDFRSLSQGGEWLRGTNVSQPVHDIPMRANWTAVFDGIVFTRTMTPCTAAKR